jgi:hypothetical protein
MVRLRHHKSAHVRCFGRRVGCGATCLVCLAVVACRSDVAGLLDDVTPPSVPGSVSGTQVGTTVELTWSASSDNVGVTGYVVYRDGSEVASPAGTSYVDPSPGAATTRHYAVVAKDAAGNESGPGEADVEVLDVTPPSVPGSVSGTQVGTTVELTWSASSDNVGVTGYVVYRDGSEVASPAGTSYVDGSVSVGNSYAYTVTARDAAGNESPASAQESVDVVDLSGSMAFSNITTATTGGPGAGGHAVAFADATGDGLPDIYVTNHRNNILVSDLFYRNLGGGTFVEEGASRGIADVDYGSHGAVWADLDNDSDYDLYNGGTGNVDTDASDLNTVYRQDGGGAFTDVTPAGALAGATRGVLVVDYERDGDLDLFAINGYRGSGDVLPSELFNEVYRNDGAMTFTSLSSGPFQSAPAGQGGIGTDYDGDDDIDLFAANREGDVNVLENVGGTYVARSAGALGIGDQAGDGITTGDVNNDAYVDLILASDGVGYLYLNDGDGTFTYHQSFSGTEGYMGGLADLDNDGDLDLVFAGDYRVWVNDGSGTFSTSVSFSFGTVDDPRSIAFADIDADGDVDFFVAQKTGTNRLIRNDYAGSNGWLEVRLTSPQGQAGAFGSKVRVYVAGTSTLIAFREARGAYGYVAQDDPVLHMGLGHETLVDVVVDFLDGSQTVRSNVAAGQLITVP